VRASVLAVRAALVAVAIVSAAQAAESDEVRQQTQPTNTVEVGAGYVSQDSFKFGEYNGLFNKGVYGIFGFRVSGGGSYDSDDATRWRVTGTDLGLDTRDVAAQFGQQGKFSINFGYDELRRARSDSYQTPYLGNGTNTLTLPSNWARPIVPQVNPNNVNFRSLSPTTGLAPSVVNGVSTPPNAAQQAIVNNILANDVPDFHNVDIDTKRTRYDGGFSYNIDPNWRVKVSARHEKKDGLKLMSTVSSQVSEFGAVIPDLIDQTTDQYNASLTYTQPRGFFQVAYYGSVFKNDVPSMTWTDVNDPSKSATMSSAPSNDFHQFLLSGGYNFTPTTRLVVKGSYARNTQDDALISVAQNNQLPLGLPTDSLHGLVVTTDVTAKLTAAPVKGLNLAAGYKYNDRDNRTPVNTYFFQDANEARASAASAFNAALGLAPNTLGSNINIYANRPYSKKVNQFTLDGNYAIAPAQTISGGYEYEQIDRSCPGSWINCADAPRTRENTLKAEWHGNPRDDLDARVSYAYSQRRVDYDENAFLALVPMANVVPAGGATESVYQYLQETGLTGFGPVAGFPTTPLTGNAAIFSPNNNIVPQALYGSRNNINEEVGMRRFNMADRNRNKARATVNWQANDKFALTGNVEFNDDDYDHSVFGLKSMRSWAATIDGSYSLNDALSANLFYTYEDRTTKTAGESYSANSNTANVGGVAGNTVVAGGCFATVQQRNNNAKIDPCNNWATDMRDKVSTLGGGLRYRGLMSGKLDLGGDVLFSWARTNVDVSGGSYVNNPFAVANQPAVTPAVLFIPAQNFPTVTNNLVEFRLTGIYSIDKSSAIRAFYWYQHLHSTDFAYDGMQFGTISAVMPTNEQAPSYNVSVVGISYLYSWQ
jgi:MtrB/PioB family decaheme-associated outer membrane protein